MKKIVCTLFCALLLTLTGCGKDVPALDSVGIDNIEAMQEEFADCTRKDLIKAWGNPDGTLSGLYGDVWDLGEDPAAYITVYYNDDGTYNSSLINYQIVYTGTVTEITEPSGEAITTKITVELDDGTSVVLDSTGATSYTGADSLAVGNRANFLCSAITGSRVIWLQSAEILG